MRSPLFAFCCSLCLILSVFHHWFAIQFVIFYQKHWHFQAAWNWNQFVLFLIAGIVRLWNQTYRKINVSLHVGLPEAHCWNKEFFARTDRRSADDLSVFINSTSPARTEVFNIRIRNGQKLKSREIVTARFYLTVETEFHTQMLFITLKHEKGKNWTPKLFRVNKPVV